MARVQYNAAPYQKHMEVFRNFVGGLNTSFANEVTADNELRVLKNVDLGERGILRKRPGMKSHLVSTAGNGAQGYFRYYKQDGTFEEIVAVSGILERNGQPIAITGLQGFQSTRPVEAVQFRDKLYIATGTKLLEYNGTEVKVVDPHKPQPLEALYIGTNALAADPNNFMTDGEALSMRIDGVTFSSRYGIINQPFTMTAYISKPSAMSVEYMFEWRYASMEDGKWVIGQDWSTSKTWTHTPTVEGDLQFRVNMREAGLTVAEAQYLVPKYKVKPAVDPNDNKGDVSTIHNCNRIILHWNRLIMYGDDANRDVIYISHLNNPNYFPVPNTLRFENPKNEKLTTLIQYRDMIVAFTDSTIQALYGKGPQDYRRVVLNTSVGCVAPYSAQVVDNYIFFLSYEGVYMLKEVAYSESKSNVQRIDDRIRNIITKDTDACASFFDGQYQITFPSKQQRFRFYLSEGVWTMDESPKLNFLNTYTVGGKLYGLDKTTSEVRVFDESLWTDAGILYECVVETRMFDFGQPNHYKKLKELQLVLGHDKVKDISAKLEVYADAALIVNPDEEFASVDENGYVVWNVQEGYNLDMDSGTVFGSWELGTSSFGNVSSKLYKLRLSGKCRQTRLVFSHKEDSPFVIYGAAYVFKIKKV